MLPRAVLGTILVLAPVVGWIALETLLDARSALDRPRTIDGPRPAPPGPAVEPGANLLQPVSTRTVSRSVEPVPAAEPESAADGIAATAPPGAVLGRVRTPDGEPVVGLTMELVARVPDGGEPRTALTDAEGRFELNELAPAAYWLWGDSCSTRRPLPRPLPVTIAPGERTFAGELLSGGGPSSVAGRVLDRDGAALEGVRVSVHYSEPEGEFCAWYGATDARGRYSVEGLDPGAAVVVIAPLLLPDLDERLYARRSVWLATGARLELEQRFDASRAEIARRRKDVEGLFCAE